MSVYFDSTPRAVADASNVAITLGQAGLGGTIAVRLIVDDAVAIHREIAIRHIEAILNKLVATPTWPPS